MKPPPLKTRFCPSPTGHVHLGNLRTALFSALYAKSQGGTFLLRIEDTDAKRSNSTYQEALITELRWLGIHWDEGPKVGGDAAPYWQSQREAIYGSYIQQLIDKGRAYPCFCTEDELLQQRKLQLAAKQPPRYAGTCARLSPEAVAQRKADNQPYTLRFRIPSGVTLWYTDLVKGKQCVHSHTVGDFIIRRADGSTPFMFSNAIDDALMGVTHALRGDDHLANTPRQIWLMQALGLRYPVYGHLALVLGDDGAPLSKRNGSQSLRELRELGYLPMAVVNYLARLGHHYASDAWLGYDALAAAFDVDALGKSPAHFDAQQLLHWQKESLQQLDDTAFWAWCAHVAEPLVPADRQDAFVALVRGNVLFFEDIATWAKILLHGFQPELACLAQAMPAQGFMQCAIDAVKQHGADYTSLTQALKSQLGVTGKALFMPLRLALTGRSDGPELAKMFGFLGPQELVSRFEACLKP